MKVMAEFLLAQGADANAKDARGLTPLRWATRCGHKEVGEFLRQRGGKE